MILFSHERSNICIEVSISISILEYFKCFIIYSIISIAQIDVPIQMFPIRTAYLSSKWRIINWAERFNTHEVHYVMCMLWQFINIYKICDNNSRTTE